MIDAFTDIYTGTINGCITHIDFSDINHNMEEIKINWSNCTWQEEDKMYAPKRKVNNKGSKRRPHIIGSFHSPKMLRAVEYESLNEYLFYSLLELDPQTIRYYVQPVEISIPRLNKSGKQSDWPHIPDVLVFRQQYSPHLYQVKEKGTEISEKEVMLDLYCKKYAFEKGWEYSVVYPKSIPKVIEQNVKFLMGFINPRTGFEMLIPEVVYRLEFLKISTIEELSREFQGKVHPLQVLPVIYHLIAMGTFEIDMNQKLNEFSKVMVGSDQPVPVNYLLWGWE